MKTPGILANAVATLTGIASLGALVPSTAAAQSACYVPGSGTIYRIKEQNTPTKCSTGHVEFQLVASAKPSAGGNGGSGLPINADSAFDFSNVNGFMATGTSGFGNYPASGAGHRIEWISRVAALRSGSVDGTQWDSPNVGWNSAAFGWNVTASGPQSFAANLNTLASGYAATAIGTNTVASGNQTFAAGYGSTASGPSDIALGASALASGGNSVALGFHANSAGNNSVAIGPNATTNYPFAIALGSGAFASASGAMALGGTTASGTASTSMGSHANTVGMAGAFIYGDNSTTTTVTSPAANSFTVRAQHFWLGMTSSPTATAGRLLETSTGAYLSTGGAWTNTSDVNKKHGFKTVDGDDILARVDAMPLSTWTYNTESDRVRHMGPTAQDFRKAFGLGDTDKAIATVDADGVSLAAVKALITRTKELRQENSELKAMVADLAQRLSQLEQARR